MKAYILALALLLPGVAVAAPADDFDAAVQQVPQRPPVARPNRAALSPAAELQRLDRLQRELDRITRIASQTH